MRRRPGRYQRLQRLGLDREHGDPQPLVVALRHGVGDLPLVVAVEEHEHAAAVDAAGDTLHVAGTPRDAEPQHVEGLAAAPRGDAGEPADVREAFIAADRDLGADLVGLALRRVADAAHRLGCDELQEPRLGHERDDPDFVEQLEHGGMQRVAAEVPLEVAVRLHDHHADALAGEQQCKHETGRARADDHAIRVVLHRPVRSSSVVRAHGSYHPSVKTRLLKADQPGAVKEAAASLARGELVAFPTDTVYGLAAGHDHVRKLFLAKDRPKDKRIPVLLADAGNLEASAIVTASARALAARFWPGPLSLVLVAPRRGTLAFRVPANDVARQLLAASGGGLPVTSANRSGQGDARTAEEVLAQLEGRVALVLDCGRTTGTPSTVVDCTTEPVRILREGALSAAEIEEAIAAAVAYT
ncbi:hypothetical protein BH18CHL2_BH18CHL2_03830 [soil metagenome]